MAREIRLSMRVWDAPVRLFHWAIVILVAVSWTTGTYGYMDLHYLSGETILALLLFRLVWGFVGSDTARFARFLRSPIAGLAHLARIGRREPDSEIGHNAAGGWMVLLMLLLLLFQVGTGLFSAVQDDGAYGPLSSRIADAQSEQIAHIHMAAVNVLLAVIGLHVLAIIIYALLKRQNLLMPMLTGRKRLPATTRPPRMANPLLALLILVITAGAVGGLVHFK
jgi:cytochrome b